MRRRTLVTMLAAFLVMGLAVPAGAGSNQGSDPKMMYTSSEWIYLPLWTVGESIGDYTPVGIPDGIAAYQRSDRDIQVLLNHELNSDVGEPYTLANGTELTGARISSFDLDRYSLTIDEGHIAYDTIYGRPDADDGSSGDGTVDGLEDLESDGGLARFCSSVGYAAGEYGFVDDIYFAGEESGEGTEWALDVANEELWAIPDLGRGSWENVTALDTGDDNTVALLLGDDFAPAPLYLYVGEKDADGGFLERNGLVGGQMHVWVADNGATDPNAFNGTGSVAEGSFVAIDVADANGVYKSAEALRAEAFAMGAFAFSRPEDLATNPENGAQAVMASTGRGQLFESDDWGATYVIDVDFEAKDGVTGTATIIHDADDEDKRDFGIRSADNLDWGDDGYIYIQEDRSTANAVFGEESGRDASIWQLTPDGSEYNRIAWVNQQAIPEGQGDPTDELGNWETSGILDVTTMFDNLNGTVLIGDVQAHSIRTFPEGSPDLVQGGQLFIMWETPDYAKKGRGHGHGRGHGGHR